MKQKLEKIYNVTAATIFSIYALIALLLLIFVPKYNILFKGWWTFIIMLPSLGSILFHKNKLSSIFLFTLGALLLVVSLGKLELNKCFTILACLGIILIGINIIKGTLKIPANKNSDPKYVPLHYAFLGSSEEKITGEFLGGQTKVVFGYLYLDLKEAEIKDGSTIKAISLFGETEIALPEDIELVTSNTNILGGTENLKASPKKTKKTKTVYVESISIFGSTKLK